MKFSLIFLACLLAVPLFAEGPIRETMADRNLRRLVDRQKELLAEAAAQKPDFDTDRFRNELQTVCHGYEALLRENPGYAPGYAAYGYLLSKTDNRKQSIAMLMKANQLDADLPLVKNQIGNYLAEEGRPLEAVNYFLAAVKLDPREPLYHYQLGTLLTEARDEFLKSGEWERAALDRAMQEAFRQAAELAPDRFAFAYRHAESFYDLEQPDWEGALKAWSVLEEKSQTPIEVQTMRLHAANILLKMNRTDHARALLSTVTEEALLMQKQKLVAQLKEPAQK